MLQCPLTALQQRAFLYQQIRAFFQQLDVLEVETPVLSGHANTDVNIDVFSSQGIHRCSGRSYLRTSPEFFHKRMLASGVGDLFEIAKVFRLGEASKRHNPEFTMLEWYRLDFELFDLIDEVSALMQALLAAFDWPELPVRHSSYAELAETHLGFNPLNASVTTLNAHCRSLGYHGTDLDANQALDFLFGVGIEPKLSSDELLFVYHFPASQAALAAINPDDAHTCLRFELLWQGVELANGYQELTDAKEQQRRFQADNTTRQAMGKSTLPYDQHLIDAMTSGLPNCSGVAMGLDRLLMLLTRTENLQDILPFPADRA